MDREDFRNFIFYNTVHVITIGIVKKFVLLWFNQYSLNINIRGFCYLVDPQNILLIELQILLTFCIDKGHWPRIYLP